MANLAELIKQYPHHYQSLNNPEYRQLRYLLESLTPRGQMFPENQTRGQRNQSYEPVAMNTYSSMPVEVFQNVFSGRNFSGLPSGTNSPYSFWQVQTGLQSPQVSPVQYATQSARPYSAEHNVNYAPTSPAASTGYLSGPVNGSILSFMQPYGQPHAETMNYDNNRGYQQEMPLEIFPTSATGTGYGSTVQNGAANAPAWQGYNNALLPPYGMAWNYGTAQPLMQFAYQGSDAPAAAIMPQQYSTDSRYTVPVQESDQRQINSAQDRQWYAQKLQRPSGPISSYEDYIQAKRSSQEFSDPELERKFQYWKSQGWLPQTVAFTDENQIIDPQRQYFLALMQRPEKRFPLAPTGEPHRTSQVSYTERLFAPYVYDPKQIVNRKLGDFRYLKDTNDKIQFEQWRQSSGFPPFDTIRTNPYFASQLMPWNWVKWHGIVKKRTGVDLDPQEIFERYWKEQLTGKPLAYTDKLFRDNNATIALNRLVLERAMEELKRREGIKDGQEPEWLLETRDKLWSELFGVT